MTNTLTDLLRNYETATTTKDTNPDAYGQALQDLATACTYAVLKKLCNVGGEVKHGTKPQSDSARPIRQLRQSLTQDLHNINNIKYAMDNATTTEYNQDGERQTTILDKDLYQALTTLCSQTLGDGIDLVHTAIVAILDETAKADTSQPNWTEQPYDVRRLKRKVYIKKADSVNGWETAETTPIQEVYRAIRRDISSSRSVQTASHKYTYLDDIITDPTTGAESTAYKRLPKYSGLAYEMTDYNGKVIAITADTATAEDIDALVAKMNLSIRQATVLDLRMSGYGKKAIGTYLGIDPANVKRTIHQIQKSAKEIGLDPDIIR